MKSICLLFCCLRRLQYCFQVTWIAPLTILICSGVIFITAKTSKEGKKILSKINVKSIKKCLDKGDAGWRTAIKQFNVICSTTSAAIISDDFPLEIHFCSSYFSIFYFLSRCAFDTRTTQIPTHFLYVFQRRKWWMLNLVNCLLMMFHLLLVFLRFFYIPALLNSNLIFSAEKLNWNRKSDKVSRFFGYQMSKLTYQKMIILMIIQRQPIFDAIISCERKGMKREDEMICVLCGFVFSHNSSGSQVATETL